SRPSCAWSSPTWSGQPSSVPLVDLLNRSGAGAPDHVHEVLVHPRVRSRLRVEGGPEAGARTYGDDPTVRRVGRSVRAVDAAAHLDALADALDPGSADEHAAEAAAFEARQLDRRFEGIHLAPEGVAPHRHRDDAEGL